MKKINMMFILLVVVLFLGVLLIGWKIIVAAVIGTPILFSLLWLVDKYGK